jgi:hypothetical protein
LTEDFKEGFQDNPGTGSEQYEENLYEWSAGTLRLVNILPDGVPASEAGRLSDLGGGNHNLRNAISGGGSRVVFETTVGGSGRHLFVRDVGLGQTVQLDVPQAGIIGAPGPEDPVFVDASSDGSRIFFTDTQRLTPASNAREEVPDLYVCEVSVVAGVLSCSLKDISGEVLGVDLGVDETGRYVYYAAGSPAAPSLFVSDVVSGETRRVAELAPGDRPDWATNSGGNSQDLVQLTARVSGNGRFVVFMSAASLTGYDNRDAASGQPDEEVFLYDRVADSLRCVSCNPTGARPVGVLDPPTDKELPLLVDRPEVWHGRWLAGSIGGWEQVDAAHALYAPRNLDNSGRVFFDSADGLVVGAANGKEDVYEFEPDGVGGCQLVAGCVGLISSGSSSEESAFVDAGGVGPGGGEGEDVFLMTAAKLVGQDTDNARDIYDAHVCSGAVPCASGVVVVPPACNTSDSCRSAPMAQPDVFGPPASATFSGPGITTHVQVLAKTAGEVRAERLAKALKACREKKKRAKRVLCERQARRAYAARAHKTSVKGRSSAKGKASRSGRAGAGVVLNGRRGS